MTYSKAEKRGRRRRSSGSTFGLCKCFRPTVEDDEASHKAGATEPAFVVREGCALLTTPALVEDCRMDKKVHRGLSAGTKAVFFETSLGRKSRKSKYSQELSSTMASECSDSTNGSGRRTDSSVSTSSLSLDSSLCSSLTSSSRSYNYTRKPSRSSSFVLSQRRRSLIKEQQTRPGHHGLCVLFITLLVLVLWGKICAIICTSTWLYIMSHGSIAHPPSLDNRCENMDSAEYRKRVVLGGFLDRKRSRSVNSL